MSYLSAKYVREFRCNGAACGSACCRGWKIELTRDDYSKLKGALANAPAPLRPLADQVMSVKQDKKSGQHPFAIHFNESGTCPYVTPEHLCQIHAAMGPEVLPAICAQYPREVKQIADRREMWASLSCPEAARLCLLDQHGADLVEIAEHIEPRYFNQQLAIDAGTADYVAYLDEVRRFVVELLSVQSYPLRTRLFFVAYFAHRVSSYFHVQSSRIDGRRLAHDMEALRATTLRDQLAAELDSLNVPGTYAISLVESIVKTRDGLKKYPATPMPGAAQASITVPRSHDFKDLILATAPWLEVWMDYSLRRAVWERDFARLLEQAFENYCKIYWMKEWYTESATLLGHASACMLRVAILRYRLFHHPVLKASMTDFTLQQKQELLERTLVTVVTEVARAIEHDRPFQTSLATVLARHGMLDLAHAGLLLVL